MQKCRGKSIDSNKWVYGWYCEIEDDHFIIPETTVCDWSEDAYRINGMIEVIPETVGQYTGLKDKKRTKEFPDGQPIYKGDIVRHLVTSTPKDMYDDEIVIYDAASFKYERCNGTVSFLEWPASACLEVIGNIYQDPELQRAKV